MRAIYRSVPRIRIQAREKGHRMHRFRRDVPYAGIRHRSLHGGSPCCTSGYKKQEHHQDGRRLSRLERSAGFRHPNPRFQGNSGFRGSEAYLQNIPRNSSPMILRDLEKKLKNNKLHGGIRQRFLLSLSVRKAERVLLILILIKVSSRFAGNTERSWSSTKS